MRILLNELLVQFSVTLFVVVLSADLLYLYHAGGWREPNNAIRKSELGFLYAFVVGGIVNAIRVGIMLLAG